MLYLKDQAATSRARTPLSGQSCAEDGAARLFLLVAARASISRSRCYVGRFRMLLMLMQQEATS